MLRKKTTWILLVIIGMLSLVSWFAYTKITTQKNASEYEQWVGSIEKDFARSTSPQDFPDISMKLENKNAGGNQFSWLLQSGHTDESKTANEQIMRLLDLVSEAKIFATSRSSTSDIQLTIIHNQKTFKAFFNKEDIEKNLPLGNFIKLFQIYSNQRTNIS